MGWEEKEAERRQDLPPPNGCPQEWLTRQKDTSPLNRRTLDLLTVLLSSKSPSTAVSFPKHVHCVI